MSQGNGSSDVIDLRGESHLDDAALLGTLIAFGTIFAGLAGISACVSGYQGKAYRRTQVFAFIGLWSRGGVFIGPFMILLGMAIISGTRVQFEKKPDQVAQCLLYPPNRPRALGEARLIIVLTAIRTH